MSWLDQDPRWGDTKIEETGKRFSVFAYQLVLETYNDWVFHPPSHETRKEAENHQKRVSASFGP